jgi:hypothetical protein
VVLRTNHGTRTVQELLDLHGKKRLNLAPGFQRNSVWSGTDRQLLIRSLLDHVPIPSIYLYRQVGRGGSPVYDVIDGKQRLETILLFLGRGPLASTADELWVKADLAGELEWWSWKLLAKGRRNDFLTTPIPTIEVEGEMWEIVDLFVRINSTGKRLDGQERRHALYYKSPILKSAQGLAERHRDFLLKHKVLSDAQVQRMKHVELMTELLLGVDAGTHLNKKAKLDQVIAGGAIEPDALKSAARSVTRALALAVAILPDLRTTRYRQAADFYSLVMLLNSYREEGRTITAHDSGRNALAADLLRDFGRGVDEVNDLSKKGKGASAFQEPFRLYLMTVREGTDSAAQRRARERVLRELLDGVFDDLDPTRAFNAIQRRILWHPSATKDCAFCHNRVARWEDLAIDHIQPYIKGGKTDLSNAALAHKKCNAAAGAKW